MTTCRDTLLFAQLGKRQLLSAYEPALTVETYMPPMVGSALTSIYQTAACEPDGGLVPWEASGLPREEVYTEYVLPAKLGQRKSLESHTAITNKRSAQYRLQQKAKTDALGLRKYKKRYMVAVGTYFNAPVGVKIDVYLSGGSKLKCIVGDIKSDADTIGGLTQKNDGSVVEFIVDWRRLDRKCKRLGSMHALEEFDGYVEKIVVYKE